jgi:hypothetical protein
MDDLHILAAHIAERFLDSPYERAAPRLFLDLQQLALLTLESCGLEQPEGERDRQSSQ